MLVMKLNEVIAFLLGGPTLNSSLMALVCCHFCQEKESRYLQIC